MKAYKGFNKDMTCRGFQFEEVEEHIEINKSVRAVTASKCISIAGYEGIAASGTKGFSKAGAYGISVAGCFGITEAGIKGVSVSRGSSSVGERGLAVVRGNRVVAKGGFGAVIVIAIEDDYTYNIKDWKAGVVDGKTLKPDTWYTLKNGEFVEVEVEDE